MEKKNGFTQKKILTVIIILGLLIIVAMPSVSSYIMGFGNSTHNDKEDSIIYPEGKNKSTVIVGDIVKIGNEEFYVINNDGANLVLLAHYNLKVGNIYENNWIKTGEFSNKDEGYGLQSRDARGWVYNEKNFGTVAFSSTNYWNEKVGKDYSGNYCNSNSYVTGTKCAYVYDENSNIKTYVDAYKKTLERMGVTIKEARLLRVEEAYTLGCGNGTLNCKNSPANAPSWVYETSYWLGSACESKKIWRITSSGDFHCTNYSGDGFSGVRPVIVI